MLKLDMPTDNFYKFLTFIGVALVVGGIAILMNASRQMDRNAETFLSETKAAREYIYQYQSKAKRFIGWHQATGGVENMTSAERQQAKETFGELAALNEKMEPALAEVKIVTTHFERRIDQYARTRSFFIGVAYLGLATFLIGAFLWYLRTQRPMDKQRPKC